MKQYPEEPGPDLEHAKRWWDTYNAAVTGFLAGPDEWDLEVLDEQARDVADRAHGPLDI